MALLESTHLKETITAFVHTGKPLLGICLGMQLLFDDSEENGRTKGLGLLRERSSASPRKIRTGTRIKCPIMGWNHLNYAKPSS